MEEVRQITDLLDDAEKSVSIIKNVFKIQGESPYFTISPNEAGQFILDDVLAFISKYNIKNNIDDEDLKEAAKDDSHCAVGWIDKTGEDFKSVLEDLFIKLPAECRQGVTARFIRRAEGILSSLKEDSDCTIALLAFVKYGEKERFYMTPSNESFSIDELMNLCISLLTVAYQMLYFLGEIYFDFTGNSIIELVKRTLKDTEGLNLNVFEEYSEKPGDSKKKYSKRNEFTLYRKKEAIIAMLEALGVDWTPASCITQAQVIRFTYFLTGMGTFEDDIRNTSIANVFKPVKDNRNDGTINNDLEFVAKMFESIGLKDLAMKIRKGKN